MISDQIKKHIEKGHNLFITGSAGTGKSHLLSLIKETYGHVYDIQVTASTGIAAVQVGGVTIHSWASLGVGNRRTQDVIDSIRAGAGSFTRRKMRNAHILAIDEISMLSPEIFSQLDEVLKNIRENQQPFGGLQLILIGDFLQLPPISRDKGADVVEFCFETEAWKNAEIHLEILEQNFRQTDPAFLKLLANLRIAKIDDEDRKMLNLRTIRPDENDFIKPTIIVTHNEQAARINMQKLACIDEEQKKFIIVSEGKAASVEFLVKNCLAPAELCLKIGAQVMMLKNSYQKEGIYNGSLGVVVGFSKEYPMVEFAGGKIIKIMPDEWKMEKFNEEIGELEVLARIKQLPLTLAWAITVHKSQGMSLDKIDCDLSRAFTEGQIYVTISRVRSLEGLFVRGINYDALKVNPKILKFYGEKV